MVSHPETGSDSPIGSDRDRGRDKFSAHTLSFVCSMSDPFLSCLSLMTFLIFSFHFARLERDSHF